MFVGGMWRSIELESFEGEDLLFLYLSELNGEVLRFGSGSMSVKGSGRYFDLASTGGVVGL